MNLTHVLCAQLLLFTNFNDTLICTGKICSAISQELDTCAEWPMSLVNTAA